jgi:hypothetical protein
LTAGESTMLAMCRWWSWRALIAGESTRLAIRRCWSWRALIVGESTMLAMCRCCSWIALIAGGVHHPALLVLEGLDRRGVHDAHDMSLLLMHCANCL